MPLKNPQTSVLQSQLSGMQSCELTWYDPALGGTNSGSGAADPYAKTASGEHYDPNADTCAAPPQYPFGTFITFYYNFKSVTCKVNDRGGAITGSHFDLSRHAANTLGIVNAGKVNAQFQVSGTAGQRAAAPSAAPSPPTSGFVLSLGSLFSIAASDLAQFIFDAFIKFPAVLVGDYLIIPAWHWNQRAVMHFQQNILFGDNTGEVTVGVAAFWGLGYVLLWGDPDAKGWDRFRKRTDARRSHFARHVQRLQSLPARQRLVKPRDVKAKTAVKPTPTISTVSVEQVGTMATSRPERVKVHGHRADKTRSENGRDFRSRTREGRATKAPRRFTAKTANGSANGKPDAEHRARFSASQNRGRDTNGRSQ